MIIISLISLPNLKFSFDFEQFFPQGDEDLEFFQEFIKDFESDDNFLLIAVENEPTVFDTSFLKNFAALNKAFEELPHVIQVQSLSNFAYPVKTPFGIMPIPALHLDDLEALEQDKERILSDERFVFNLINEKGTALVSVLKTTDQLSITHSYELIAALEKTLEKYNSSDARILGRAFFQQQLSDMQKREVVMSTILGAFLVGVILILIFRKPIPVLVAFGSIGLGLLLFFGLLILFKRELNAIAAFYPVLMLIVGTSDVIHIMTKYIDELKKGLDNDEAIKITIKEIGMATLLTSMTTAVGFLSLLTSRLLPIQGFGVNSAMGVILAFVCVILFTCSVLSLIPKEKLIRQGKSSDWWENKMLAINDFTKLRGRRIVWATLIFLVVSAIGISKVSTNYNVKNNLPRNSKITDDFEFFEREMAGFRPLEFAVTLKGENSLDDYEVIQNLGKLDKHLRTIPAIKSVTSIADVYKSINQMFNANQQDAYVMPVDEETFNKYQPILKQLPNQFTAALVSTNRDKTRISTRIKDLGADKVSDIGLEIDQYVKANINPEMMEIRRTGTGLIFDKNAVYIRENLTVGLGLGLLVISLLMGFLFRNYRMLFIALVPNILPLIFAAALMGFVGIKLEAVLSIVFALIFGIAVDDSIHFLSKYKMAFTKTRDKEEALRITFVETGKAICFTTIILFFGFMIMLFSIHPPSVTIGVLIGITLITALISDLYILPVLIRKFL